MFHENSQHIPSKKICIVSIPVILLFILSCTAIQKYLDRTGIESSCDDIMKDYRSGDPAELSVFIKNFSLDHATSPFNPGTPEIRKMGKWKISVSGENDLVQEKLFFNTPLSKLTHADDKLVVYVYRPAKRKSGEILLFIPGMGVSDPAFFFIKNFFKEIITRRYTLVIYIPPYHLERIESGKKSGEGFFNHNAIRNIRIIAGCTAEIRSITGYYRSQGVSDISAWGGSMGASFLLLSAMYEPYSHLTVMIPVLDWNSLMLDNPGYCVLKQRLLADGYPEDALRRIYNLISPINYPILTPPEKILIMSAEHDQLTSTMLIKKYRQTHNNPLIKIYNRSHSTILTDYDIYSDYADQLDKWVESDH